MEKRKRVGIVIALVFCVALLTSLFFALPTKTASADVAGSIAFDTFTPPDYSNKGSMAEQSGAVLTTTSDEVMFDLGTYDLTGATAEKPLVGIMPYMAAVDSRVAASGFIINFSSGDKFIEIKSFTGNLVSGKEPMTLGVRTELIAEYLGTYTYNSGSTHVLKSAESSSEPWSVHTINFNPYKASTSLQGTWGTHYDAGDTTTDNRDWTFSYPVINFFIDKSNSDFSVYTDQVANTRGGSLSTARGRLGETVFNYNSATQLRYKMRDLTGEVGVAWTPFTADELQNVKITVRLYGVTGESKIMVTSVNGAALTAGDITTKGMAAKALPNANVTIGANGKVNDTATSLSLDIHDSAKELTITPDAHYEVDTFTVGGADKKAEIVDGKYTVAQSVASDVAVNVTFKPKTYTISYNANGGDLGTNNNVTSYDVEDNNITLTNPTGASKTGYTFGGWSTDGTSATAVTSITTATGGDYELKAYWTPITVNVTFDSNEGSAVTAGSVAYDSKLTEPDDPEKTGYDFAGWYTDDTTFEHEYDFNANSTAVTDFTLYAKWTIKTYAVTFTDGVASQTINHGAQATEPTDPTKTGYTFDYWYTTDEDVEYVFTTPVTGALALNAKWTINTYTVTFSDGVAAQTINHGEKAVAPTAPTKSGYEFGGWYVGNVAYDFNSAVTANVELTAKWTAVTPETPDEPTTPSEPTTPDAPEKKDGCAKEAAGMLAVVLTALAAALVIKRK